METAFRSRDRESLVSLISGLREDVRHLFQQEVQLAKTELGEKAKYFGRNGLYLATGGIIGGYALLFFLLSLAFIIALGLQSADMSTGMALFLGFIIIAVCAGAVAGILVFKAISAFRKQSVAPEKTIETIKEIAQGGLEQVPVPIRIEHSVPTPQDNRSSDEIRADVEQTRQEIGREVRGIRFRLRLSEIATGMVAEAKTHPGRWVGIGVGTGLVGFVVMRVARLFGRRRAV